MADNPHHEHLVKELTDQLEPVFSRSPQAVYLYLDDEHKICNKKFADLLGYLSPQEWVDNPNPVSDVIAKDRDKVIDAYVKASDQLKASTLVVSMTTKKGQKNCCQGYYDPGYLPGGGFRPSFHHERR